MENAAVVVAASGGSTNAALHLPAIANEAGIKFTLEDVTNISKKTPYIADLKPGGKYVAKDLYEIGGVPILIKALLEGGFLHEDCLTGWRAHCKRKNTRVTCPTCRVQIEFKKVKRQNVTEILRALSERPKEEEKKEEEAPQENP